MTEEESRKAFEAFASELHIVRTDSGRYSMPDTEWAWSVWQAAISWSQAWRPMDSAPKDGTSILVLVPANGYVRAFHSQWCKSDGAFSTLGALIPSHCCLGWLPLPPVPKEGPK